MIEDGICKKFKQNYNLLVVLGPTASGKTGLAIRLARRIQGEIISVDSRQVYRGMDLGTGKDLLEYMRGGEFVPHHLIDILDPSEEFSVFDFRELFCRSFQEITGRGKIPIMTGGTGFYLDAVLREYRLPAVPENRTLREKLEGEEMESLRQRLLAMNPEIHNSTDLMERKRLIRAIEIVEFTREHPQHGGIRLPLSPLVIGIRCERNVLRQRITERLKFRLEGGMVDEVRCLNERGIGWERIDSFGLEYRYIGLYLQGKLTREEMFQVLNTRIHQYAKRQETWFRRMEKKGVIIHWISGAEDKAAIALIEHLPL